MITKRDLEVLRYENKLINFLSGICGVLGVISLATAMQGTQQELTEYCFKPKSASNPAQFCTTDKRYLMPESQFLAATYNPSNPAYQRINIIPDKATRLKTIPPTNPFKPWWATGSLLLFGAAYWLTTMRSRRLQIDLPCYREEVKSVWSLSKLNNYLNLQKAAYSANTDYEFHKWSVDRNFQDAQFAAMHPSERAALYQHAELEEQALLTQFTTAPELLTGQSLEQQTSPVNKIESNDYAWMSNLLEYPALIFGGMGSGKSWTTREIIKLKVASGQKVTVLDPHGSPVEWKGVNLITDHKDIAKYLDWYIKELNARYEEYRNSGLSEDEFTQKLIKDGRNMSVVCEEFTTYADHVASKLKELELDKDLVGKFFKVAMTESRKMLMCPLFIAHDRTLTILGDSKGMANLRDSSLLELQLIADIDPSTRRPVSSGKGKLKLPGHGAKIEDWIDVQLPKITKKCTDFTNL